LNSITGTGFFVDAVSATGIECSVLAALACKSARCVDALAPIARIVGAFVDIFAVLCQSVVFISGIAVAFEWARSVFACSVCTDVFHGAFVDVNASFFVVRFNEADVADALVRADQVGAASVGAFFAVEGTFVDVNALLILHSDVGFESVVAAASPTAFHVNAVSVHTFVAGQTFVDLGAWLPVVGWFISGVAFTVPAAVVVSAGSVKTETRVGFAFVYVVANKLNRVRFVSGVAVAHQIAVFVPHTSSIHAVSLQLTNEISSVRISVSVWAVSVTVKFTEGNIFVTARDGANGKLVGAGTLKALTGGDSAADAATVWSGNFLIEGVSTLTVGDVFVAKAGSVVDAGLFSVLVDYFIVIVVADTFVAAVGVSAFVVSTTTSVSTVALVNIDALVQVGFVFVSGRCDAFIRAVSIFTFTILTNSNNGVTLVNVGAGGRHEATTAGLSSDWTFFAGWSPCATDGVTAECFGAKDFI
jgi:hypothetical protein